MMKRSLSVLLIVCLALCLASCSTTTPPADSGATTTAASTSTTAAPLPSALPQAVVELDCLQADGRIVELAPAGEGLVALRYGDTPTGINNGTDIEGVSTFAMVDTVADKLLRQDTTGKSDPASLVGVQKDGKWLIMDPFEGVVRVYDEKMTCVRTLSLPEDTVFTDTWFRRDQDTLYISGNGQILSLSPTSGKLRTLFTMPQAGFTIADFDPITGRAVCTEEDDNDATGAAFRVYNVFMDDGAPLLEGQDNNGVYRFSSGRLLQQTSRADGEERYTSLITVYDGQNEPVTRAASDDLILTADPASPFALATVCHYEEGSAAVTSTASFLDIDKGILYPLRDVGEFDLLTACFLPEAGHWVLGVTKDNKCRLIAVDPARLEGGKTLPVEPPAEPISPPQLADYLQPSRQTADVLEAEHGVRILLGDECLAVKGDGVFDLVSTQAPIEDGEMTETQRADQQKDALQTLREALERYPVGFFEKFKTDGRGGLRFLYVRDLPNSTYENFTAAGVTYDFGLWYNVALDVDAVGEPSIHHELWHAVELLLNDRDMGEAFPDEDWEKLNPDGFSYSEDFDHYDETIDWNDVLLEYDADDPYFAISYSMVNPKEDRATLIEEVMTVYDPWFYGETFFENGYERVLTYPHLKAKLDAIAAPVRELFGSVYWEK